MLEVPNQTQLLVLHPQEETSVMAKDLALGAVGLLVKATTFQNAVLAMLGDLKDDKPLILDIQQKGEGRN